MKSLRGAMLALAIGMSVAGCAAVGAASSVISVLGTVSPSVSTTGDKVVLEGTRALVLANNAYQAAANGLAPFVAARRFSPDQVNQIERYNNCANALLQGDDATASTACGMTVTKALTAADRAAKVFAIADQFSRMISK
jgi:hypothetical protein